MLTVHVILSLVALVAGIVVLAGLVQSRRLGSWTVAFLATAILTSATGFLLSAPGLLPSHVVGILSLIVLLIAVLARYTYHLHGAWRWVYVVCAVIAFWFNAFVGVVQAFQKIGPLHALAPQGSEPPFQIAQGVLLLAMIVVAWLGVRRFDRVTV